MKKKLLILMFVLSFSLLTACGDDDSKSQIQESTITQNEFETETSTIILKSDYATLDEYLSAATNGVEKNSSAMVDTIARLAKADAETATESELETAIAFIRDTYPDYFVDDATMEKTMYYGCLLDYAFDDSDIRSNLGTDANQAVKYVYRKVETVEDQATQENLSQIQEALTNVTVTNSSSFDEDEISSNLTMGQTNALQSAKSYLSFSSFSYEGLIEQLEYEQCSAEDATFAADNCGADWNKQALKKAAEYLDFSSFSRKGLIEQLLYEKFTEEQANYAVDNTKIDWNEQAAKKAKEYLEYSSFSRDGLIEQLLYEGFSNEEAEYGVAAVGY